MYFIFRTDSKRCACLFDKGRRFLIFMGQLSREGVKAPVSNVKQTRLSLSVSPRSPSFLALCRGYK